MSRKGKYRGKKRKGRVVIKQQVTLAHKNDATRVTKSNIDTIPRMPVQMPRSASPVFKVKIRRKYD